MRYQSLVKSAVLGLALTIPLSLGMNDRASAFSVCGLRREEATFRTKSYLVTICRGEASFQLISTFHDGTGYRRVPVQQEGRKFRGSEGGNNFIIDRNTFVIGTDGKEPIREAVIQSKFN
ncbi:MAG: hypothetical protein N5P05_000219 [Chroococcopsis gigantea SAG 12.99]|jgi:hypothetical protein|nr:hypothetical protein [Chlorogloea purpurea SAG 13.99]MDV2998613.1 hypothetical protein [Chroococcopsis gigantea SAG 12.99]